MSQYIFITIIILVLLQYLSERWLNFLNRKYWSDILPVELQGIYDQEKYKVSQRYERDNDRLETITSTLSAILILVILGSGLFGYLNDYLAAKTTNPYYQALSFFGILGIASGFFGLPFEVYGTFVIEQKYGFNKTTVKTFILDKIKGLALAVVLGGGILSLLISTYYWTGNYFCLIAWVLLALFSILMNMFYSSLIVPIFNKQSPLEEGSLRQKILKYAERTGFKINNIFVLDGSKRSTKANAYFSGMGPKKRIILFDTLINENTEEEIVAVLAHEVGHNKKKHTIKNMILSLLESAVFLFLLSLLLPSSSLAQALGASSVSFHLNLLGFVMLYTPISFATGLMNNYLSRKFEYQADRFASETYSGAHLGSALIKMSVNHLSNLRPHPAYVFCYYSHPPLLSRLKSINSEQDI